MGTRARDSGAGSEGFENLARPQMAALPSETRAPQEVLDEG